MSFSEAYGNILSPFLKKFQEAGNQKLVKAVLKDSAEAVTQNKDLLEFKGELPKNLEGAILRYFKRCVKKTSTGEGGSAKPGKVKQVYTIRDVIKNKYQELIEEYNPYKPTDKEFLGSYQKALSKVQEGMSKENLKDVQKIVDLWNSEGASSEVKLKTAKRKLPKEMKKKVEDWKFSSGALVMCLVAYRDGEDVQAFHVESSPLVGNSFTNSCKEWRDGTYENFKQWAVKQFDVQEPDSDDGAEVPVDMQKAKDIVFEKNGRGVLILPPKDDHNTTKQRQRVVRGYIGAVYREFTKYKRAAFPYLLASKEDQTIFSPECVPEGFTLIDPDHLPSFKINDLYNHWLQRQKKQLPPFVVINAGPLHRSLVTKSEKAKGKRKMDYLDVTSSSDEGDEKDEDEVDLGAVGDSSEDESVGTLPTKIGPPVRKQQKASPAVLALENPSMAAGSSKLPPNTSQAKKSKRLEESKRNDCGSATSDALKKKRKRQNEEGQPKLGPKGEKEEATEVLEEPPAKKTRVGNRDTTRVKEYPGGNTATSFSRIAFLKSLCALPSFLSLVDLVPTLPGISPTPKDLPSWASWRSQNVFLPASFHKIRSFNKNLTILKKAFQESSLLQAGELDVHLLMIGLMYREVSRVLEVEPDGDGKSPDHLVHSPYGVKHLDKIQSVLDAVVLPS